MKSMTSVQNLDEAVSILFHANALGVGMSPSVSTPNQL